MNEHEAILKILDIAMNAPELNMGNYDIDQVKELNNAMIEIYQIAFSCQNSPVEISREAARVGIEQWKEKLRKLLDHSYDLRTLTGQLRYIQKALESLLKEEE
jgi:hypothetical protein